MPATSLLDIDGDGLKDLLVSPFDPNPFTSANKFSSWLYRDAGTREVPDFTLNKTDFLQGGMIDAGAGACPVMADYDGDGLQDLFIGNYGYYDSSYYDQFMILHTVQTGKIALYRNSGSLSSPVFSYVTDDFASASSLGTLGLMPAFADLDGDGDLDMLTGRKDGNLLLFKNIADPGQPMIMQLAANGFANIDIGDFSAAQLFDLDRDGRTDLILGEKDGNLNYYKGVDDSPWMGFIHVTDSLGGINVTNPNVSLDGYSVPFFFRDALDRTLLVVGSEDGKLFFYTNIDGNLDGDFSESDTLGTMLGQEDWNPDRGYRTAAALTDLDGDGFPEMLAGNFSGGLEYFSRSVSPEVMAIAELPDLASSVKIYPNPARCKVSIEVKDDAGIEVVKIEVYSAQGLLIRNIDLPGTIFYNLNTDGFEPGIYYLTITLKSRNGRLTNINKKLAFFN
jgi:hypothetical protein